MPRRPKSICRKAGCSALIDKPGWCEKHTQESVGWNRSHGDKTAEERGYGPNWRYRIRPRILRRDLGMCKCAECVAAGRVRTATEVDHVVNKAKAKAMGWTQEQIDADSNLQAINTECHKAKTARER